MAGNGGSATSDMKHNGLRKRLDVLGFSQPLPLGAVPLVGAILEDLIRTTESLKQQKDQVHTFMQEKNAWELGVEAYKCDNSKLLSEVSVLNKQLIQQKDQYEAKKCEFSRRIRNLEMDKNYLETHLQELGERFEELESKYQDVLDPKRKASRKPFVSTVRSGSLIRPPIPQANQHNHHNPPVVCPIRCPASAMRKDLEVERDHLKQENIGIQERIEMQSKQIEVRDREIDRLAVLLSTEGRPVKALAEDCCYRNVKRLHEDVDHLQRENSELKSRLAHCEKSTAVHSRVEMMQAEKEHGHCGGRNQSKHPCETHLMACKMAAKSCEEVQRELREKEKVINELQVQLSRCKSEDKNVEVINKLSDSLADRVKLQDSYVEVLSQQQRVLREGNRFGNKSNCENEPVRQCKNNSSVADVVMSNVQRQIECLRRELEQMSVFNERQDSVRKLQNQLELKDCEINKLKSKSCLSPSSMMDGANGCGSTDRSWKGDCCAPSSERVISEREHCIMKEELKRLSSERDHLKHQLNTELDKFCVEREALNNTLDKLKCRLEGVERDNRDLLAKQEPKNAAIMDMQSDVKQLRCQIEVLRNDNDTLQCKFTELKRENIHKDQVLEKANQQLCEMDMKLKQSTRKLQDRGNEENKLFEDMNRVNAELRKCRENYSSLESQNARISAQLSEKLEEARNFQSEVEGFKQDQCRVVQEYESMKKKYSEQLNTITVLQSHTRELSIEIDTYKCQIESLRNELECSTKDNKKLADQLSGVECEFSNTKRLLTESQMRNDVLQSKIKEYMLEVNRVGKLLEEKEKERDEMVDNLKKLSECTCRLRSHNIAMGTELCQNKQELVEANKRIAELQKSIEGKEQEMNKLKADASKAMDEVCIMRADLEKCYETHKKLHSESTELRKARQEMIMNIERLKNELETWKTLHDEMKNRNDKLKRELKVVQCEDYPHNVKKLQEILSQNRESMDTQVHKIASLSSELAEAKDQLSRFKQAMEEEKCRQDPLKKYLEKGQELEKLTSGHAKCCEEKAKHVSIITPCEGNARRSVEPPSRSVPQSSSPCRCAMNLESTAIVVSSPGAQITGGGVVSMKKKCSRHPIPSSFSQPQRECIPIPRSRSYNGGKQSCNIGNNRHKSCSPSREISNRQACGQCPGQTPRQARADSNTPLDKMCVNMNMSGMVCVPPPPPPSQEAASECARAPAVSATQVGMDSAQSSTKRLFDDVRSYGQAKRQWNNSDEIEAMIKQQKLSAPPPDKLNKTCTEKYACSAQPETNSKACSAPQPPPAAKAPEVIKASTAFTCNTEKVPPKRQDIPKRSLVTSFIPKEQKKEEVKEESKQIDDATFKPSAETSALEKGFNSVVNELKSITHNIFGKTEDTEKEDVVMACSNKVPEYSDTVKQRIQKFQTIVNDASKNIPKPVAPVAPMRPVNPPQPPTNEEANDESKEDSEKQPQQTQQAQPQQGIIRRVIGTIAQNGIQGLSTLHKEDDEQTKAMKELTKKAVEHDKSELLNYSAPQPDPNVPPKEGNPQMRGASTPRSFAPSRNSTPRRQTRPAQAGEIALPSIPIISPTPDVGSDEDVIDLTESLKGGNASSLGVSKYPEQQSSPADSEIEYIPGTVEQQLIHTVSSTTRNGNGRSTIRDSEDRFQNMIHTEPSIMRHEDYNKFAKHSKVNAPLSISDDDRQQQPQKNATVGYKNSRRGTIPFRANQYVNVNRGIGKAALEQDDGCVATSSASDSADEPMFNGQFVSASAGNRSPLQRGGLSIADLSARHSPKILPVAGQYQYVDHMRGHDSGPTLPFSDLLSRHAMYDDDSDSSSSLDRNYGSFNFNPSENSTEFTARSPISCRSGLAGGSENEEGMDDNDENNLLNYAHIQNGSEDSLGVSARYQTYVIPSDNTTPQSFKSPYYGTEFSADDGLKNLNQQMTEIIESERKLAREAFRDQLKNVNRGAAMSSQQRGKDFIMSKYVNMPEENLQRNYLDGLQDSIEASTNDEISVTGTSTGTNPMKFFCSLSRSMDKSNPQLNVNLMVLGNDDLGDDFDCSRSVSCMSESTQMTQGTRISVENVYFTYSQPDLTESMLISLIENDGMGGGESSLTSQMDSIISTTDKSKGFEFNDENVTKVLDHILRSHDLLSTSDEMSLATASAPALQQSQSEDEQ